MHQCWWVDFPPLGGELLSCRQKDRTVCEGMQQLPGARRQALLKVGDALSVWVLSPACSRCSGRVVAMPSTTDGLLPAKQWPTCSKTGPSTLLPQDFPAQLPKSQGTSHCTEKLTARFYILHLHSKPGVGDASGDVLTLFTFSSNQKTLPTYLRMQQKYLLFLDISSAFSSWKLQEGWATQCTLSSKEAFYYCSAKLGESIKSTKQAVTVIWVVALFRTGKRLPRAILKWPLLSAGLDGYSLAQCCWAESRPKSFGTGLLWRVAHGFVLSGSIETGAA